MGHQEIPKALRRKIANAFLSVISSAKKPSHQYMLLGNNVGNFVATEAERKSPDYHVVWGEKKHIRYYLERFRTALSRLDALEKNEEQVEEKSQYWVRGLANLYAGTIGYSYVLKKNPHAKSTQGAVLLEKWKSIAYEYRRKREHEIAWAFEQLAKGSPYRVMDFQVRSFFNIARDVSQKTEYIRVVAFVNGRNESTGQIEMRAIDYCDPRHFREFVLKNGNFSFGIGESAGITDLQMLHEDINRKMIGKTVYEQNTFGWREIEKPKSPNRKTDIVLEGLWFFKDAICSPTGEWLLPDKSRIVRWQDKKYRMSDKGSGDQSFVIEHPQMRVDMRYQDIEFEVSGSDESGAGMFSGEDMDDKEICSALFREFYFRLHDTLGGANAGYVLGSVLAFASAPEIFKERGEFPGLWLHGKASSGKTHIGQWLVSIWGFFNVKPLELKGNMVTAVGLNNALSQVSNLPIFCDEFKADQVDTGKLSVIHNTYNRARGAKYASPGMERQEPKTSLLIAGETTSSDPAARGRYAHVAVSADLRKENHWDWFLAFSKYLCLIGRYILTHRMQFVTDQLLLLKKWMEDEKEEIPDERQRFVYGVGYSGFAAAADLLKSHHANEIKEVKDASLMASIAGVTDVEDDIEVNRFWSDVVSGYRRRIIPRTYFKFKEEWIACPPNAPNQGNWRSITMYVIPLPVIDIVNEMRAKQRMPRTLDKKDLLSQMKTSEYWIGGKIRQRFGAHGSPTACWGISLDYHPLGYHAVSDEELEESLDGSEMCSAADPRFAGGLYHIYFDDNSFQEYNDV